MSTESDAGEGTADKVAAWLLYVLQLAFEAVLLLFAVFSVMMSDGCGTGVDELRICSGQYFTVIFYSYLLVLVATALAVPLMIRSAGHRGRLRWLRPVGGIVLLAIVTVAYVVLVSQ
ncbi:MAG: hypothetical protein ACR2FE_05100 [Aeromicrobium sp.]